MDRAKFSAIFTTDPHSYNTLKNEYDFNGKAWPVFHISEILDSAIKQGRLPIKRQLGYSVTYQDPCYLGRYNNVYDAPRRVIEAVGCKLVEMPRNRDRALCCAAGGGRIWMEEHEGQQRPSEIRIREAAELQDVQSFVVTCPKDYVMFGDAAKTTGHEERIVIKDLIDLVHEAL
jgi:Fe-S oxidoreductase